MKLPVMEIFHTIQGEGEFQGHAAIFVRLGGCDVGCVWCDVKESWDANAHPHFTIKEIVDAINHYECNIVVVTGGEPLMYDLSELTTEIKKTGRRTHIETSGAYPTTGSWDWYCLSPKKFKFPLDDAYKNADELKVIAFNKSDFKFGEDNAAKVSTNCKLLIQTEWDKRDEMSPLIVDYVKKNPKWCISLQTHKYLNIP